MALLSNAEITSSGRPAIPSSSLSVPAPADLRPSRPDNKPVEGAINGVSTLSPYRERSVERKPPTASATSCDQRKEDCLDRAPSRFPPRQRVGVFRQEGSALPFVRPRRIQPPF